MMAHWINEYIGIPWESGAKGPGSYDCFGLVQAVMARHYGVAVPDVDVDPESLLQIVRAIKKHKGWAAWERIDRPEDGAMVKMCRQSDPNHVGVFVAVDGGCILHAPRNMYAISDTPFVLKAMGWKRLEYYRYRGQDA
jgi:cell wall-associated NlpC family hydrolase